MKKLICMILALVLVAGMTAVACAESSNKLGDFANRLKKAAQQQGEAPAEEAAAPAVDVSFGPALRINDPFYQKVRSSAFMHEDKYSKEANVMIELKNVSGRTLYPDSAAITAYNAAGEVIDEETYASCGPEMVENGDSLFIWDWFYGLEVPVADVAYFEVKVESDTDSYTQYAKYEGQALVSDGIAYALIENTKKEDIYGVQTVIAIENEEGTLLDVCEVTTGNAIGLFPGSTMVQRANAKDYAADAALMEGIAKAYVLYELD